MQCYFFSYASIVFSSLSPSLVGSFWFFIVERAAAWVEVKVLWVGGDCCGGCFVVIGILGTPFCWVCVSWSVCVISTYGSTWSVRSIRIKLIRKLKLHIRIKLIRIDSRIKLIHMVYTDQVDPYKPYRSRVYTDQLDLYGLQILIF